MLMRMFILGISLSLVGFLHPDKIIEEQSPIFPRHDAPDVRPLRWIPKAKAYRLKKVIDNKVIYDTLNRFTPYGFRSTGQENIRLQSSSSHLFLVGCSATFGHGVEDQETFAYRLGKRFVKTNVVNMGLRGAGPHDNYFFWRYFNYTEIFPQKRGVFIFTIIPDHLERWAKTWRYLSWAFHYSTDFKWDAAGRLVYQGTVSERWDFKFARLMKSNSLSYWFLRATSWYSDYQAHSASEDIIRVLAELKRQYLRQYPKGRFVVSWMSSPLIQELHEDQLFRDTLKKYEIEFWEPPINSATSWGVTIPGDGHPSASAHKNYAKFLTMNLARENLL